MFKLLDSLEWKYPPSVLMEQPEALMDDLRTISWRKKRLEELLGHSKPSGTKKGQIRDHLADKVPSKGSS